MNTNDLFAVAKILAELNRFRCDFKLIICGEEFKNTNDNNFSIYHWHFVLRSRLEEKLKKEADNKINYELFLTLASDPRRRHCKVWWDDSIRRYKFSMTRVGDIPKVKTFYSLNSEEAHKEIIKMISSY
ncbi:hypothetical protein IKH83_03880 [Candidatus Saccharibacteria bacterium]|nr:hypothetical protein [Candidatus Saccharibacteria bacterium]